MKVFITAFYGRIAQYSKGIELYRSKGDKTLLQRTILNNIYKGDEKSIQYTDYFIDYMAENINHFISNDETENQKHNFKYINIKYKR